MPLGLRFRLSVMMFSPILRLGNLAADPGLAPRVRRRSGLSSEQIGWVYTVYGFGAILGPFVLGQLADRYLATEIVMALAHLIGGVLLIATAYATGFWPIFLLLFAYCNLYMPTMGLSNSITFRSVGEGNQDRFPAIRMWGTIGWIAAGLFFAGYLKSGRIEALKPLFDIISCPRSAIACGSRASSRSCTGFIASPCRTPRRPRWTTTRRSSRSRRSSKVWS